MPGVEDIVEVRVVGGAVLITVDSEKLPPGSSVRVGGAGQAVRIEPNRQPPKD